MKLKTLVGISSYYKSEDIWRFVTKGISSDDKYPVLPMGRISQPIVLPLDMYRPIHVFRNPVTAARFIERNRGSGVFKIHNVLNEDWEAGFLRWRN